MQPATLNSIPTSKHFQLFPTLRPPSPGHHWTFPIHTRIDIMSQKKEFLYTLAHLLLASWKPGSSKKSARTHLQHLQGLLIPIQHLLVFSANLLSISTSQHLPKSTSFLLFSYLSPANCLYNNTLQLQLLLQWPKMVSATPLASSSPFLGSSSS